jgi:hypothetical protein
MGFAVIADISDIGGSTADISDMNRVWGTRTFLQQRYSYDSSEQRLCF